MATYRLTGIHPVTGRGVREVIEADSQAHALGEAFRRNPGVKAFACRGPNHGAAVLESLYSVLTGFGERVAA